MFVIANPKAHLDFSDCQDYVRYAIYQEEVNPNSGITSFRGYMEIFNSIRVSSLRKLRVEGFATAHFEPRKGTQKEAINSVTDPRTRKPNTKAVEFGTRSKSGKPARVPKRFRNIASYAELEAIQDNNSLQDEFKAWLRQYLGENSFDNLIALAKPENSYLLQISAWWKDIEGDMPSWSEDQFPNLKLYIES